jgi:hypothetical protein
MIGGRVSWQEEGLLTVVLLRVCGLAAWVVCSHLPAQSALDAVVQSALAILVALVRGTTWCSDLALNLLGVH